jgi:hypothetical protein
MKTIGNFFASLFLNFWLFFILFNSTPLNLNQVHAGMRSSIDRTEISIDETISLKLTADGNTTSDFNPKFEAPLFDILNQFESSQYSMMNINGQFQNKSEKTITYILHPTKSGTLKIKNIQNPSTGEKVADIAIQVTESGANNRKSVGDQKPQLNQDQKNFFVKAEVNKSKVYKGEQIIVSYYLYRRTRANIRDVMQYPTFQGFIREDLEMPILSGRPDFEAVSLGGIPFERALLARYALYPVREGKLKIDGLSIRADYIPRNEATEDMMEDPFFQFFSQMTPRTGTSRSDSINIDVLNLPEVGRSSLFTGGVGDFDVKASLSQSNIKANAPLILTVTVQGKGNSSLIEFPQVPWPKNIKFFESQGKPKNLGGGTTEKVFEVVLIPLEAGSIEIPAIDFEFYNTETRSYQKKSTQPISINVGEGDGRSIAPTESFTQNDTVKSSDSDKPGFGNLRYTNHKNNDSVSGFLDQPWWRWVAWGGLLFFICFIGLIVYDQIKKQSLIKLELLKKSQNESQFWNELIQDLNQSSQYVEILEKITERLHQTIDARIKSSSRAISRRELAKILTESYGFTLDDCKKMDAIFELDERLRFAAQDPVDQSASLKSQIQQTIDDAKVLCKRLEITQ